MYSAADIQAGERCQRLLSTLAHTEMLVGPPEMSDDIKMSLESALSSDITILGSGERSRLWKLRRNIHFAAAAAVGAAPACRHAARRPAKEEESTQGARRARRAA